MQVSIETIAAKRVAFIRHVGPYQEIGPTFEQLCGWAGAKGLIGPTAEFLCVGYDDPDTTPADQIRADAAVTVDETVAGEGDVQIGEIRGGKYAVAIHKGPYATLIDSYRWLYHQWLPASGHELAEAPCFERYVNDPQSTPEQELLTAIHIPLK